MKRSFFLSTPLVFIAATLIFQAGGLAPAQENSSADGKPAVTEEERLLRLAKAPELFQIRDAIREKGAAWIADFNPVFLLSDEEKKRLAPLPAELAPPEAVLKLSEMPSSTLPDNFDWRARHGHNYITPAKSQGSCSSCWAFAPISLIEGAAQTFYNDHALNVDLSEMQVMSCTPGSNCSAGGSPEEALNVIAGSKVTTEDIYPYVPMDAPCDRPPGWLDSAWGFSSWQGLGWQNATEQEIKNLVMTKGSVLAFLFVYQDFFSYSGGIYQHVWGEGVGVHAITIVGFGEADGLTYWICKNSWGTGWGENGFFRIYAGGVNSNQYITVINPLPPVPMPPACTDSDNDHYCAWGLGPKPAGDGCPGSCAGIFIQDCDDANQEIFENCGISSASFAYLMIYSGPLGAEVYVKDPVTQLFLHRGTTPMTMRLYSGTRELEVRKTSHVTEGRTISLSPNQQMTLFFNLTAQRGNITGRITLEETGDPYAGAELLLDDQPTGVFSGADGRYAFSALVGQHAVSARKALFEAVGKTVQVAENTTVTANVSLGLPWKLVAPGVPLSEDDFGGVSFADRRHGWVMGLRELMLYTADGGKTWSQHNMPFSVVNKADVHFIDRNRGWVIDECGGILFTADGGLHWTVQAQASSSQCSGAAGIFFVDNQRGWAVSGGGTIRATTNGGQTWTQQFSGSTSDVYRRVFFIDWFSGWVTGENVVLRTRDGGATWTRLPDLGSQISLGGDVFFLNADLGWIAGDSNEIWKTVDGGNTWSRRTLVPGGRLKAIRFMDADRGWIVGEYTILATSDGGETWERLNNPAGPTPVLNDLAVAGGHAWAVGWPGLIMKRGTICETGNLQVLKPCSAPPGPPVQKNFALIGIHPYLSGGYFQGRKQTEGDGWFLLGKYASSCNGVYGFNSEGVRPFATEMEWLDLAPFIPTYRGYLKVSAYANTEFGDGNLYFCGSQIPPCPPAQVSPVDGAFIFPEDGTIFQWNACSDAVAYRFRVGTNSGGALTFPQSGTTYPAAGIMRAFEPGQLLEWKVEGCEDAACINGSWSSSRKVYWDCSMQPQAPANGAVLTAGTGATLSWQGCLAAPATRLVIFGLPAPYHSGPLLTTSFSLAPLEASFVHGQTYQWALVTCHDPGCSDGHMSAKWSFQWSASPTITSLDSSP